ncbi:hypothetical protein BH09ACT7_BH09ACT7_18280 [soil metagenome]
MITTTTHTDHQLTPLAQAYVDRHVALAPPLTDEQRTDLAELLRPVRKAMAGK